MKRVHTKKHADNSGTFVTKEGHHLKEQVEVNHLEPKTGGGSGRRMTFQRNSSTASHTPCTTSNSGDLAAEDLPTPTSAPSDRLPLVRVRW